MIFPNLSTVLSIGSASASLSSDSSKLLSVGAAIGIPWKSFALESSDNLFPGLDVVKV
jgi:hypothetical protein